MLFRSDTDAFFTPLPIMDYSLSARSSEGERVLTSPVDLSEDLVRQFRERDIPHDLAVLRCGHYSSGKPPFKFVDGWILSRFLRRILVATA